MNKVLRQCVFATVLASVLSAPLLGQAAGADGRPASQPRSAAAPPGGSADRPLPARSGDRPLSDPPNQWWPWVKTLLALAVVAILIVLVRLLLLRFGGPGRPGRRERALEVLARVSVGGRHQLLLVRMGERIVLVALSPSGVRALSEVTDAEEVSRLLGALGRDGAPAGQGGGK